MNPICPECGSDQTYEAYDHKNFCHVWKCTDCGHIFEIDESEADHANE